jgi:hypothetical protein
MANNIFDRAKYFWMDEGNINMDLVEKMIAEDLQIHNRGKYVGLTNKVSIERELEYKDRIGGDRMEFLRYGLTTMARSYGEDGNTRTYRIAIPSMFFIFRNEVFTYEDVGDFINAIKINKLWDEDFKKMILEKSVQYMKLNKNPGINDATRLFVEML